MKRRTLALALTLACVAVSCHRGRSRGGASPLDEAKVKAMSHALLDAFDRADEQAFTKMIGPTMTLVYTVRTILRDEVVEEVSPWGGTKDPVKVVHFAAVKD